MFEEDDKEEDKAAEDKQEPRPADDPEPEDDEPEADEAGDEPEDEDGAGAHQRKDDADDAKMERAVLRAFETLARRGTVARQPEDGRGTSPVGEAYGKIVEAARSGEPYAVTLLAALEEQRANIGRERVERELERIPRQYRAETRKLLASGATRDVRTAYNAVLGREARRNRKDDRERRDRLDERERRQRAGTTSVSTRSVTYEEDKERTLKASQMTAKLAKMSDAQKEKFMRRMDRGEVKVVPD